MIYILLIGVPAFLLLVIIITYNNLITVKNGIENANGALDAMLKKRYDLLPNLVSVLKNHMNYEKTVLEEVTALRTKVLSGSVTGNEKQAIDGKIGQSMSNILLSAENYPNLKIDGDFLKLQASWNECEEQIAAARRAYNAAVTNYNNAFETFPGNVFANNIMKYGHMDVIEIPDEERKNINASELFNSR